ncbi:hypothetical protein ANCCAN_19439 [Ancylostoma caninum]|uniref:Uncharacterized protein n=1 Tax=Ancylostoma caninum TaxID=29170 RepID=A0A368FRD3_ANCCA|nr:hypothetical protein ANCCAN_19439 [Ancylostoma caninum]
MWAMNRQIHWRVLCWNVLRSEHKASVADSSLKSAIMDDSSLPLQEFAMFKKFLQLVSTGRNYEARGLLFGDESTPAGEGTSGRMQPRLPFLSPLAMQVLGRFLDERQDDYGY